MLTADSINLEDYKILFEKQIMNCTAKWIGTQHQYKSISKAIIRGDSLFLSKDNHSAIF